MVKGMDSTYGLASKYQIPYLSLFRCFKPEQYDGNQVYMIRRAGGIIFAKTNNPQLGYCFETNNFIFGRGLNPYNKDYIIGGSTGGEGAMMAGRCSVIGIGSDIGGSVRFPAGFNGVYSYKPSTKRICTKGSSFCHQGWSGYRNLVVTNGPLGRYVDDLALMMKVLLNEQYYREAPISSKDVYFSPRCFDVNLYEKREKLRIGYFKSFRFVPSSASNQRAVDIAIEALEKQGHQVEPINLDEQLCLDAL